MEMGIVRHAAVALISVWMQHANAGHSQLARETLIRVIKVQVLAYAVQILHAPDALIAAFQVSWHLVKIWLGLGNQVGEISV